MSSVKTMACYAEIDTAALRHNYSVLKQKAGKAKVLAVVKANAYGHGAEIVAKALPNADGFGVARLGEALRLRKVAIENRLLVMSGVMSVDEYQLADQHALDVVIHQSQQIDNLRRYLESRSSSNISVWLKVNTGMNRLGFALSEFDQAVNDIQGLSEKLRQPIVIMSHFANADSPSDPFNSAQLASFESIRNHHGDNYVYSIANSSGLLSKNNTDFDWVRTGLSLYGASDQKGIVGSDFGLLPVMSLRSRLITIKNVSVGEGVGYGQIFHADKDMRIGIASLGYGDGYPREIKADTPIIVDGVKCGIVGRVSMDLIAIDLTNCIDATLESEVEAWGKQLSVEHIATQANTIPYTLLCGITQRVETLVI